MEGGSAGRTEKKKVYDNEMRSKSDYIHIFFFFAVDGTRLIIFLHFSNFNHITEC